jgi:hypothetical protein
MSRVAIVVNVRFSLSLLIDSVMDHSCTVWKICIKYVSGCRRSFTLCFLLKKISGHPLQYTAIVGKPSEITYYHAEYLISRHAYQLGYKNPIKRLYAVGVSHCMTKRT